MKGSARDLHELRVPLRVGGQYFQTLVSSSSQCVTPTHGKSTVRSIRTLGKASGGMCLGRRKAAGREEPRDPRALESLVVVSGVGERDRVPLGKASGAWCAWP